MLKNNASFQRLTWTRPDDEVTGKGKLKRRKKLLTKAGIVSTRTMKKSAADMLRCASAAMRAGLNHGLEVYVPVQPLEPGGPLVLVPASLDQRPFCKFVLDEAGNGVVGKNYLWSACHVRGFHDTDKCHRKDNNVMLALKHVGLFGSLLKIVMLANVNRGPWLGGMFLEKKSEALDLFVEVSLRDPKYVHDHLEGFAFDIGADHGPDCSLDDIQRQLANLIELRSFKNKSMSLELKRWFSFTYAWPTLNKEWTAVRMVLQWLQVQLAEWSPEAMHELDALQLDQADVNSLIPVAGPGPQDPANAPVHDHGPVPDAEERPGPAPDAEEKQQERRERSLAQLRQKAKNTIHLAAMVTQDRLVQIHGRIIYAFEILGRRSVAQDLKQQRTQHGTCQWYAHRALDGGFDLCMQIARVPDSMEFLEAVTLAPQIHAPGPAARQLFQEELEVASLILHFAWEYMAITAWTDAVHAQTMPFTLAAGLSVQETLAKAGLDGCRQDWEAILEVEDAVFKAATVATADASGPGPVDGSPAPVGGPPVDGIDPGAAQASPGQVGAASGCRFLRRLLDDLDFHKHQLVRETCHLFSQGLLPQFKPWHHLLPDGELQLARMFATPANTKYWCEDMFKDMKTILSKKSFNAGRIARMQAVVSSAALLRCHPGPDAVGAGPPAGAASDAEGSGEPMPCPEALASSAELAEALADPSVGMRQVQLSLSSMNEASSMSLKAINDSVFVPPSDRQKVAMSTACGMTFDLGQPMGDVLPLIDVSLLMDAEKPDAKKAVKAGLGSAPGQPVWKPAGQEGNFRSVAAMALVRALSGMSVADKERAAQAAWWCVLLQKGLFFRYTAPGSDPVTFLSLGAHGHAALCWRLKVMTHPGSGSGPDAAPSEYLALSSVDSQPGRCGQQQAFAWFFGHQVQDHQTLKGLTVQPLIPPLKPQLPGDHGLSSGLVYEVTGEVDLISFCFQQKVSITSQHMNWLCKALGLRVPPILKKNGR